MSDLLASTGPEIIDLENDASVVGVDDVITLAVGPVHLDLSTKRAVEIARAILEIANRLRSKGGAA